MGMHYYGLCSWVAVDLAQVDAVWVNYRQVDQVGTLHSGYDYVHFREVG